MGDRRSSSGFACCALAKALNDGGHKGSTFPNQFYAKIFEVFFAEVDDGPAVNFVGHKSVLELREALFLKPKRNLLFRPRARHLANEGVS
jgi:hypothetical protein